MFSIFGNPFIHPAAYEPEPEPSLAPLFRLLSDFDTYHAAAPQQCQRRTAPAARCSALNTPRAALTRTTTFTPKFDVRETATTYELHGEFPGLQRENVQIEFVQPQTLVIRGRVERRYETKPEETAAAPEEPAAQPSEEAAAPAEVEVDWEDVRSEASSSSSTHSNYHRPTVEDDAEDEDGQSVVSTPKTVASEASKPATPTPTPEKAAAKEVPKPAPAPVKAAANGRFWLVEREVGEFSRTFSFAERVEQDKVQATLENGILTVSVPKAAKHVVRRVIVF